MATRFRGTRSKKRVQFHENQQFVLQDASDLQGHIIDDQFADIARALFGLYVGPVQGQVGGQATEAQRVLSQYLLLPSTDFLFKPATQRYIASADLHSNQPGFETPDGDDIDGIFALGHYGDGIITIDCDVYYTELERRRLFYEPLWRENRVAQGTPVEQCTTTLFRQDINNQNEYSSISVPNESGTATVIYEAFRSFVTAKVFLVDTDLEQRLIYDDVTTNAVATDVNTRKVYEIELDLEFDVDRYGDTLNREIGKAAIATVSITTNDAGTRFAPNLVSEIQFGRKLASDIMGIDPNQSTSNLSTYGILSPYRVITDYMAKMLNNGSDDPVMTNAERSRTLLSSRGPANSLDGLRKRIDDINFNVVSGLDNVDAEENGAETPEDVPLQHRNPGIIAQTCLHFNDGVSQGRTGYLPASQTAYPPLRWSSAENVYKSGIRYPTNVGPTRGCDTVGFGTPLQYQGIDPVTGNPTTFENKYNFIFTPIFNPYGYIDLMLRPGFTDDYWITNVELACSIDDTAVGGELAFDMVNLCHLFKVINPEIDNQNWWVYSSLGDFINILPQASFDAAGIATISNGIIGVGPAADTLGTNRNNRMYDQDHIDRYEDFFTDGLYRQSIRIQSPLLVPATKTVLLQDVLHGSPSLLGTQFAQIQGEDGNPHPSYQGYGTEPVGWEGQNIFLPGFYLYVKVYGIRKD